MRATSMPASTARLVGAEIAACVNLVRITRLTAPARRRRSRGADRRRSDRRAPRPGASGPASQASSAGPPHAAPTTSSNSGSQTITMIAADPRPARRGPGRPRVLEREAQRVRVLELGDARRARRRVAGRRQHAAGGRRRRARQPPSGAAAGRPGATIATSAIPRHRRDGSARGRRTGRRRAGRGRPAIAPRPRPPPRQPRDARQPRAGQREHERIEERVVVVVRAAPG